MAWGESSDNFINDLFLPESTEIQNRNGQISANSKFNSDNNVKDENLIVANNHIISNDNFDSSSIHAVNAVSFIIYGGITILVLFQIYMRIGLSPRSILYEIVTFFKERDKQPKNKKRNLGKKIGKKQQQRNIDPKLIKEQELELLKNYTEDFQKNIPQNKYFNRAVEILRASLLYQNSLDSLKQQEFIYRGFRQQEFYSFISKVLTNLIQEDNIDFEVFYDKIDRKLDEVISTMKTDLGKENLQKYTQEIYKIGRKQFGLQLIYLFKQSQKNQYSVLEEIYTIINELEYLNLADNINLNTLVESHYESLEKFGQFIKLPSEQNKPETYRKLLQYVGLVNKYQKEEGA